MRVFLPGASALSCALENAWASASMRVAAGLRGPQLSSILIHPIPKADALHRKRPYGPVH